MANSRFNLMGMALFYPLFLYWGFTRPVPRKLYSDLICDNGADGTYIREILRTRKPGLWQKVSKQLFDNNFNFPEMNEFKHTEFGAGFVSHRIF